MLFTDNFHRPNALQLGEPWIVQTPQFSWEPNTPYTGFSSIITDSNSNFELALNTGTSGATEPTWATAGGDTTSDNDITWDNIGPPRYLQIVDNQVLGENRGGGGGGGFQYITSLFQTPNQFVEFQIGSLWNLNSDFNTIQAYFRSTVSPHLDIENTGYNIQVGTNSPPDGVHSNVIIVDTASQIVLFSIPSLITGPGDIWRVEIRGITITVFQNGISLGSFEDTLHSSGPATELGIIDNTDSNDVSVALFSAGDLVAPPTKYVSGIGQLFGSSLATAITNPNQLDIFQVVNEGGEIVWNLSASGTPMMNPLNPTPRALQSFFGSSFAQAFSSPYNNDIFQVVNQGGGVVFSVDSIGSAGAQ